MKKLLAPFLLAFVIVGCASTVVPETGTERYVVADGAYKALLVTVKDGVARGVIKGDNAARIKASLTAAKVALDAWALVPENPNAESAAIVALQAAREVLRLLAPPGETS
jgi:hypothetical protein